MTMRAIVNLICCCVSSSAWAFDLQGHRGTRGLAPENTLPAFARALTLGVDTLELDTAEPYLPALQRFFKNRQRKR